MDNREREQLVEAAERNAKKRRIRRAVAVLAVVVVIGIALIVLWGEGFDPRGLIKSRHPMWG